MSAQGKLPHAGRTEGDSLPKAARTAKRSFGNMRRREEAQEACSPLPRLCDEIRNSQAGGGFSLVELLVVIAVVSLLVVMAVPAVSGLVMGSELTRAGQLVGDQFLLARQEAISRNCEVQVRFLKTTDGWNCMQTWRIEQTADGAVAKTVGRAMFFPASIVVATNGNLSPLLSADSDVVGSQSLSDKGSVPYAGFRFLPEGGTGPAVNGANNFVTLQNRALQGVPPANYYTLQVDPIVGRVAVFRP